MKIIEGNTSDGSSSGTNSELLYILEDLQDEVRRIKNRVKA